MDNLKSKIENKSAKLGVIGLGYVGLPLAVEKAKAGYSVVGIDVNKKKIDMVNSCKNYIGDVLENDLDFVVKNGKFKASSDFSNIADCDCVCICVPTPLDLHQQPDVSFVTGSIESIVPFLHKHMLIILESTTYPGTTEELLKPMLESSGYVCGKDFFLAFSPERVDPGNKTFKTKNTPKVVGGITPLCTELAATLYENVLDAPIHRVSSPSIAEMEKILENTYRNVNIGLVNEFAVMCHKMNINFWEVIEAAKTKPYGFKAFYPGPGLGGHCIPLDPYYLSWKARECGFHTSMIEASMVINDRMPEYCVQRAGVILNRFKKPLNGSNILVLGVAYKEDIDDYRESPAINVIRELQKTGAVVQYFDPYVPGISGKDIDYKSKTELSKELLNDADLVIVTTAHSNVDYEFVQENSKMIFDTKNVMKGCADRSNIELL